MAEAKSRRETAARIRTRTKSDPSEDGVGVEEDRATLLTEEPETEAEPAEAPAPAPAPVAEADGAAPADAPGETVAPAPVPRPRNPGDDGYGFDEEINNRYEEIKRGSTHISELQQMTIPQLLKVAQGREADRVHGPEEAGPDLQDPQGARQAERPDVRRGHAGGAARRLRLPAQPRLQLPALPRRHLHLAVADPPLRPAHRRRRGRPDPAAQGERTLFRPAARRGHQLPGSGYPDAESRLRRSDAAAPQQAAEPGSRSRPRSTCASWTW